MSFVRAWVAVAALLALSAYGCRQVDAPGRAAVLSRLKSRPLESRL